MTVPKPTVSLRSKLSAAVRAENTQRKEPLWKGPERDGITFSLLSRFLCCRERFRLKVVEGLRARDEFSHRLEYGNMFHLCEEHAAKGHRGADFKPTWEIPLMLYVVELQKRYPLQQAEIIHYAQVCRVQFPIYVKYWEKHPDNEARIPISQEQVFSVPLTLPSGRVVRLRGKWDGLDVIGTGSNVGIFIHEHKSKGDINEQALQRQLTFDLQTMLYIVALQEYAKQDKGLALKGLPIRGVRYNVVRRPLAGGKHTIRQHQATGKKAGETAQAFYTRLGGLIESDPGYFFMRWKVTITESDVADFKRQFLYPVLEELHDWWSWVSAAPFDPWKSRIVIENGKRTVAPNRVHWRYPFGVYNATLEGVGTDLDDYIATGSTVGLERVDELFTELKT